MTSMPLWLGVASATVMLATVAFGLWGRPAGRLRGPRAVRRLNRLGWACYLAGWALLVANHGDPGVVLLVMGLESFAAAAWLRRAFGDDDGGAEPDDGHPVRPWGPLGDWGPSDERAFWNHVASRRRDRELQPR
jgi:hypothetical protein